LELKAKVLYTYYDLNINIKARQGLAWQGLARLGMAWQGFI